MALSLLGTTAAYCQQSRAPGDTLNARRVVRFSTTEGTWMSLDVSPDGRTIVFDLLGDLYALPITGGRARPLTSGPAWDAQPRFAPDGKRVAFISDRTGLRNLWVIGADGRDARQLSQVRVENAVRFPISSPAWARDGRSIVVSQRPGSVVDAVSWPRDFKWLLASYEVDSGRLRWVSDTTLAGGRAALGPVFSADGRTIYAAVEPASWNPKEPGASFLAWHIERIDTATGAIAPEMAPWTGRAGFRPAVSGDGRWLAYVSPSGGRMGLRLRDLKTYQERWLVSERLDSPAAYWAGANGDTWDLAPGYAFTPDSRALIVAFGGRVHRIEITTGRRRVIPFVVDVERDLAPLVVHQFTLPDSAVRIGSVLQPALSPDGRQVAFSALDRIWVMDLPDEGQPAAPPRRLTDDSLGEFYPSWSPDGRWLAYSTWRDGEGGAVRRAWVRSTSEAAPLRSERLTTDTAEYFNTAIAPDGRRVVAARVASLPERVLGLPSYSRADLMVSLVSLPASGGAPTVIRTLGGQTAAPAVPQRRLPVEQLYFTNEPHRFYLGLRSFAWDGSEAGEVKVAGRGTVDGRDLTGVVSPDRRRMLLNDMFTLSEVTLADQQGLGDSIKLRESPSPVGNAAGEMRLWGRALAPWMTWSRDGSRALFVQGGTLLVGGVRADRWTTFAPVEVPLQVLTDIPRGTLVLRGARLVTMGGRRGANGIIERGDLVVHDRRISALGASGTVPIPAGATVLDMTGKTILPGYVDLHDHIGWPDGLHPSQAWAGLVRLAFGVTALRNPNEHLALYGDVFAYRDRERAGDLLGPRIFSVGISHARSYRPVRTLDEARAVVRPYAEYFRTETFKEYTMGPRWASTSIAQAAQEAGLNATIHGNHLEAMVDGFSGAEHNLVIPLYDDVLTFIAKSGVTLTNTFLDTGAGLGIFLNTGREPWDFRRMRTFAAPSVRQAWAADWFWGVNLWGHPDPDYLYPVLRSAAGIAARGGRIAIGAHGDVPGMGFHYEMWLHALGGMPAYEILRSATIVGATAIGHAKDFGSLEVGKLADLQILDKNPLEDIHNSTSIRYVMKNGRLYRADDLAQIWPEHRVLPSIYRWDADSVRSTGGLR